LSQENWEAALRRSRQLLEDGADNLWAEEHARSVVQGLLSENAHEFWTLLWEKASSLCHFSVDAAGVRRFTS
jgi:hypothetical protein